MSESFRLRAEILSLVSFQLVHVIAKLNGQGFVLRRVAPLGHELRPKICRGGQRVVSGAAQAEVCRNVRAALRERLQVMKLEVTRLATPLAARVDIRATPGIP